jgi:hypothetical protein
MGTDRIYHDFRKWEEVAAGMWEILPADQEKNILQKAVEFTGNADLYGSFMMRVIREWPVSCEQAFTNPSMNHLAWVGHAACCMAIGCPEYITRRAWGMLTQQQRDDANARALDSVRTWHDLNRSAKGQGAFNYVVPGQNCWR